MEFTFLFNLLFRFPVALGVSEIFAHFLTTLVGFLLTGPIFDLQLFTYRLQVAAYTVKCLSIVYYT